MSPAAAAIGPEATTGTGAAALFGAGCDLAQFAQAAWNAHAEQPREVAAALHDRAASLGTDEASLHTLLLAEHVWLAHLNDAASLEAFLLAVPAAVSAGADTARLLRRSRWVLAMLQDERTAEPVEDRARWGGMQNLWSVWLARGRVGDVQAMLEREVPRALAHPEAAACRPLAAGCNGLAVELRLGTRGDAARDALMLSAARASRDLWARAGTWVNVERAEYQIARCHALLGDGAAALEHARRCEAIVGEHAHEPQADAFERFFVHEALWWAHHAAGDAAGAAAQRQQMANCVAGIGDAGSRAYAQEQLAAVEAAAAR